MADVTITITVNEQRIHDLAQSAINSAFEQPDTRYVGTRGGVAYEMVKAQVYEHVKALDFSDIIEAEVKAVLAETVRVTVVEAIKAVTKRQLRDMKASGELAKLAQED